MSPLPTPTESTLQDTSLAGDPDGALATPDAPRWSQTEMNGVSIGCWQSPGWLIDTSDGLLLAEHTVSLPTGEPNSGMMVYIFVPEIDHLDVAPENAQNFAMAILSQIITNPEHMGDNVAVSEPAAFRWGAHHAAYYLITSGEGFNALVIGIALPDDHERLVVINVSMPSAQAESMRAMLPHILNGLTIDGVEMDSAALVGLPDPFDFPMYPHGA